jgi:signal transduction histidine kinase/CheY-like chemotaxis protein
MSAANNHSSDGAGEREAAAERVLVLMPGPADAALCRRFLGAASFVTQVCTEPAELCAALDDPPAALVIAEEALRGPAGECIRDHLAAQPTWSALPVVVLTGAQAALHRIEADFAAYGRVTLLQRPVRTSTLVGFLRLALQDRRHQYRIRDLLAERTEGIDLRDEFLAMLGHELRNPLAAIMISAEVLESAAPDSDRAAHCRAAIGTQARQMKHLLDDLSDMSRIHRRKLRLEPVPVDLRAVLTDAVSQVDERIRTRRQQLELELDGPPAPVLADPMRLRQVFANLLTNANRYSPEGGHIHVRLATDAGLVRVSVRDDGAGLSAEALQRVFEPFYQERREGSPRGGLGIGLTLASSLVQMHAGQIAARSAGPGCGSEFVVTLPLHAAAEAPPQAAEATRPPAAASDIEPLRILLIEDNRDFAIGLSQLLEARGHSVSIAGDGFAGLRLAQERLPDVILLDIGLPGLDGYEVARRLRRIVGLSGVRIVAVSGFGRRVDRQRSRRAGIDRHLVKPVALGELETAIA